MSRLGALTPGWMRREQLGAGPAGGLSCSGSTQLQLPTAAHRLCAGIAPTPPIQLPSYTRNSGWLPCLQRGVGGVAGGLHSQQLTTHFPPAHISPGFLGVSSLRSVEWEAGDNRSLTVDAAAAVLAGSWGQALVPVGVAVRWVLRVLDLWGGTEIGCCYSSQQ